MPLKIVIKVRLILELEGKILLLKQTSKNGGKYVLVGGKMEKKETPIEALIRESYEEAGIHLLPVDLELVHTLFKRKPNEVRISMHFRTVRFQGEAESKETDKFKRVAWFPLNKLPAKLSPTTHHVLYQYKSGNRYSEYR